MIMLNGNVEFYIPIYTFCVRNCTFSIQEDKKVVSKF